MSVTTSKNGSSNKGKKVASASTSTTPTASTSTSKPSTSDTSTTTLLISSLPPAYTSDSLSALLSAVGPIRVAFIVTAPSTGASAGYGFAKFVLREDAEKAIQELNGSVVDNRKIKVSWANRRQRVDKRKKPDHGESDEEEVVPEVKEEVKANTQNAYAARRLAKRGDGQAPIDNVKDSKTIILEGGLDTSLPENKKALAKKLKKLAFGINTGYGILDPSELVIESHSVQSSPDLDAPEEKMTTIECPNPRTANSLAEKLHNTVLKGKLVLAKVKFENDLVERKGRNSGGGRLIVRNLGFDVTPADLATVFCPFGPLHSISLHKGFSFIWYLRHASASSAIEKINNTRVYPGMYDDRVREAGEHEKASMVKKLEKGKIYNIKKEKGRLVAVDWALGKDEFQKIEKSNAEKGAAAEKMQVDEEKDSDDEKEDSDEEEEDDDDDMPVAIDDDQDASDEDLDPEALAPPSDAEESMESDMDDDDDDGPAKKEDIGTTVFVRNIMFEATENELFTLFKAFGPVRYARIVMDPVTKRSRGTGFVNFYKDADAQVCLDESARLSAQQTSTLSSTTGGSGGKFKKDRVLQTTHASLLTADASSASASRLTLHGRVLAVSPAVSKDSADKLRLDRDRQNTSTKDRRNLYLMHEGVVLPGTPLAASILPADVNARNDSFEARRGLLRTNPALYISRNRLAIRQIPLFVTEGMLKRLAGWAIKAYETDVKKGKRSALTEEELKEDAEAVAAAAVAKEQEKAAPAPAADDDEDGSDGGEEEEEEGVKAKNKKKGYKDGKRGKFGNRAPRVKQSKILRQDDRLDPLTGLKRSKGYGFLETYSHGDALKIVRWANANNTVHGLFHQVWNSPCTVLFHTWWMEELTHQLEKLTSTTTTEDGGMPKPKKGAPPVDEEEKQARVKRMREKLAELKKEDTAKLEKRQGKTLIIEFSIENAMTVKRRDEKVVKFRDIESRKKSEMGKRKREMEEEEKGREQEKKREEEEKNARNEFGSMIGKKRRIAKARKGGK